MKKFSVLLLYPSFMVETNKTETYLAHVEAKDVVGATKKAQQEAADVNLEADSEDFKPLMVVAGHVEDLLG